jgi:hypothetical protein
MTTLIDKPITICNNGEEIKGKVTKDIISSVASWFNEYSEKRFEALSDVEALEVIEAVVANFEHDECATAFERGYGYELDSSCFNDCYWDLVYDMTGYDCDDED